jgi:hypothetical protein
MNNLKENIFNFGVTIYLMSRADRQAANRYNQLQLPPKIEHTQKSLLLGGILHGIKPIFQI